MNTTEFQEKIKALGCVFGIFKTDKGITTCILGQPSEGAAMDDIGIQLLVTSIRSPRFGDLIQAVAKCLKNDRKDIERLVDHLDPVVEIKARAKNGNQNQ